MGYETRCHVRVTDATGTVREADAATVLLETGELIVRGAARVRVPRAAITDARVHDGTLTIEHPGGSVALALGDAADRWLARVREAPKPLIDRLDVAPGARVWVSGVSDESFLLALRERTSHVRTGRTASRCDVVFLAVEREADLPRIARAASALAERGALWVVHPKGKDGVKDTAVFAAAREAGLTYTKVARFSETHTAEKLVRPRGEKSGKT